MRRKLGLIGEDTGDAALSDDLMTAMTGADWTLTFRRLADPARLRPLFDDFTHDGGLAAPLASPRRQRRRRTASP
jgi:hypothetical protein